MRNCRELKTKMGASNSHEELALHIAIAAHEHRQRGRQTKRKKTKRKTNHVTREALVRSVLEVATRSPWPSERPHWLLGERGRNLELDCSGVGRFSCAVEVMGEHHVVFNPFYTKTRAQFERYRRNDALKASMCRRNGVLLLYVPHRKIVADADIPSFVIALLARHRVLERSPFVYLGK